jgi:hypothetical protein
MLNAIARGTTRRTPAGTETATETVRAISGRVTVVAVDTTAATPRGTVLDKEAVAEAVAEA